MTENDVDTAIEHTRYGVVSPHELPNYFHGSTDYAAYRVASRYGDYLIRFVPETYYGFPFDGREPDTVFAIPETRDYQGYVSQDATAKVVAERFDVYRPALRARYLHLIGKRHIHVIYRNTYDGDLSCAPVVFTETGAPEIDQPLRSVVDGFAWLDTDLLAPEDRGDDRVRTDVEEYAAWGRGEVFYVSVEHEGVGLEDYTVGSMGTFYGVELNRSYAVARGFEMVMDDIRARAAYDAVPGWRKWAQRKWRAMREQLPRQSLNRVIEDHNARG